MKIKTSDLRDFFKKSAKIKSNGIIPIYDYLLIEFNSDNVSITKTNGNAYCKHTIEEASDKLGQLLIEEARLSSLVSNSQGEHIQFKVSGKKVTLTDGKTPIHLQLNDNISTFKTFPENEGAEVVVLSPDVLSALNEARNFAAIVDCNFHYVYAHEHNGKHFVFASNRHILYRREFEEELPSLALTADVCSIICGFNGVQYYTAGNYDFFDTGNTVYGFIKTTYKVPAYMPTVESIDLSERIIVDRADLLSFCELVNSLAVKELPIIGFNPGEDSILAYYNEPEYSLESEKVLEAEKNFWPEPFSFNASFLKDVLKCFTSDEINLSTNEAQNIFGVTSKDDEALLVSIGPVQHLQQN